MWKSWPFTPITSSYVPTEADFRNTGRTTDQYAVQTMASALNHQLLLDIQSKQHLLQQLQDRQLSLSSNATKANEALLGLIELHNKSTILQYQNKPSDRLTVDGSNGFPPSNQNTKSKIKCKLPLMKSLKAPKLQVVEEHELDSGQNKETYLVMNNDDLTGNASPQFKDMRDQPLKKTSKWDAMFAALELYKDTHGHCIVPRCHHDLKLACWVVEQRKQYHRYQSGQHSSIDQERIDRLNELGFTWDAQEAAWERHMDELRTFYSKHKHCDVPRSDKKHHKLYLWIREQRRHYQQMKKTGSSSVLSQKRIDALKGVGFAFESVSSNFNAKLQELTEFHCDNGHFDVPRNNPDLYSWVQRIRLQYGLKADGKDSVLRRQHIQALNQIGFPWIIEEEEINGKDHWDAASVVSTALSFTSSAILEVQRLSLNPSPNNDVVRPPKKRRVIYEDYGYA